MADEPARFARLQCALRLFDDYRRAGAREPGERFLAQHPELRDLLEPLLAEASSLRLPETDGAQDGAPAAVVPGYRLERELGRGGMGVVYAATRLCDGRRAAVKLLGGTRALSASSTTRFQREAQILQRLEHPGIVRLLDAGGDAQSLHFAMELVDGTPLDRVIAALRARPVASLTAADLGGSEQEGYVTAVVRLVADVADALQHAHEHGVIHRDVKPANVMLRDGRSPVLTDFGIARDEALPAMTLTGDFAGTPYYVSPEQAMAGRVAVDHRTDVFSLGALLYELLTLRRPFDGRSSQEVFARILHKEPPDPVRYHPRLPPSLSAIVFRALEKDPDRRYATAAAFAADLRALLDRRAVRARRVPWPLRLLRQARRQPLQAAALVLGVLLVGATTALIVSAPRIAAARAIARAAELETLLEEAYTQTTEGTPDRAVAAAEAALAFAPDDPEALHVLVLALVQGGASDRALHRLAPVAGSHPLLHAWLLAQLHRDADAGAIAAAAPPPAGAAECFLAGSLELVAAERGEPQRMRTAFELLLRGVLQEPPRRLHHALLAHAAGHLEDRVVGPRIGSALQALWPDSAHAWFWSGFALVHADRRAGVAAYRRALQLDPGFGLAWSNLGAHLEKLGEHAEAEAALRRAIELRPGDAVPHYNLGFLQAKTGRGADAEQSYVAALRLQPGYAEAHCNLGAELMATGRVAEGATHLRAALDAREAYPEAHLNLANALQSLGDADAAIAHLRRALELRPRYDKAHLLLAMLLGGNGGIDEAVEHWQQAVALQPKLAAYHDMFAGAMAAAQRHGERAGEALRWAELEPGDRPRWRPLAAALQEWAAVPAAEAGALPGRAAHRLGALTLAAAARVDAGDDAAVAELAALLAACEHVPGATAAAAAEEPASLQAARREVEASRRGAGAVR